MAGSPNPLVIPAGFAECTFVVLDLGNLRRCTFSIGAQLGSTELSLAGHLATWFSAGGTNSYELILSNLFQTQEVEVVGHSTAATVSAVATGASGVTFLPPNCSAKMKKETGVRGKPNKGYMFWPGVLPDSHVDSNGLIDGAQHTALQNVVNAMLTAMSADGSAPVILHHALSSTTTPTPITAVVPFPSIRTQRRRLTPRA